MALPTSPDLSSISNSRFLSVLDLSDQHHHHSNMDNMEIDLVTIPDTPDRFSAPRVNNEVRTGDTQNSSGAGSSGISNLLGRDVRNRVMEHSRSNIDNPSKARLFSRPRGSSGIRGETQQNNHQVINLVDSPSASRNAHLHKRMMTEKVPSQPRFTEHTSSSNDRAKLGGDTSSIAELLADDRRSQGKNKETINDSVSSLRMPSNAVCTGGRNQRKKSSFQGNASFDINDCLRSSSLVGVSGEKRSHLHCDFNQNTDQMVPRAQPSTALPRKSGQRKLVRNGCISPNNIAKASESHDKSHRDDKQDGNANVVSKLDPPLHLMHNSNPPISGENNPDRVKGKGVMVECSTDNHVNGNMQLSRSSIANSTKEAVEDSIPDNVGDSEEKDGWRCTRNRTNNALLTLSDGAEHLPRTAGIVHSQEISNLGSSHRRTTPSSSQASSRVRTEVDGGKGHCNGTINPVRRLRKRGSNGSGECSTSVFDDSDRSFVWPSEEPSNARSTRSRSNRRHGNLQSVIEIDDASPDEQSDPQDTTQVVNDDSYARERQLEADEILARELQEQFYHELPGPGTEEVDANIAWTLQHEEEAQRASSLRRQRVHPRDASMSHLYRHNQTQAIQDSFIRSATSHVNRGRGRAPSSTRSARGRARFPGNSRTISSRGERSISFHPNLDIEMRMHILEVLEAAAGASEPAVPSSFFDLQRDFNENDYEMLLALDENNHQHVGATSRQINGLPESTVQTENFEEACAICLETPSIGDTVRHLPCFHKFHKDCIDPWLRRKTACPICKSDVT